MFNSGLSVVFFIKELLLLLLLLLVYKTQCGLAPQYLVDVCQPVSAASGRIGL